MPDRVLETTSDYIGKQPMMRKKEGWRILDWVKQEGAGRGFVVRDRASLQICSSGALCRVSMKRWAHRLSMNGGEISVSL